MKYVLTSILIFVLGIFGLFNPLRDVVSNIISPVQFGLTKVAFSLKEATSFFSNSNNVRKENLDLLARVQKLEEDLVSMKQTRDENILLKEQLKIQPKLGENVSILIADVMGNPEDTSGATILIRKGRRDGVSNGDIVAVGQFLVGTIKDAGSSKSVVELITSPNFSFTVYDIDSPTKATGLAQGRHGSTLNLERILPTETISIGDTVVTSGKDGTFIPDLIVGKITDTQEDPSQALKRATVQTSLDFGKLTKVFVLKLNE